MFQPGNKYSVGRPRISLSKPELLLPVVFMKGSVNWASDFLRLYRSMKERELTPIEQKQLKLLLEIMPYLCTKVQLKEINGATSTTPADSLAQAKQTSKLLQALEAENVRPSTQTASD